MRCGLDVAGRLHLDLACDQFGRRRVADGDENAVDGALADGAGFEMLQPRMGDLERILGAMDVVERRIPDHFDLRVLEQPVLQNLLGAQAVAPVHQRDLGCEIGQEQRLLDRGIAATDHQHLFAAIEEAVAGGAGGHAVAAEFLLRRQIEPARLRAGGEDQRLGDIDLAGIAFDAERPPRQIDLVDVVGDHLGADMGGLLLHLLHEPRPLDHVGEARIVLDVGGGGELAAGLNALDHNGIEHGTRRIDRRRIAGRA